jgi:hypothetical protein
LRAFTKELNKIKLERKKGKNIQKKVKKERKQELKQRFQKNLKKNRKGAFEKVKKSFESSYKRIE